MKSKIVSILIFILFAGTYAMAADVETHRFGYEAEEGGGGGLPKTGQTSVYTSGDDGTYQMGYSGTRFTDNGDGTVTDNATGLMWVADSRVPETSGFKNWETAISSCEGLTYAGYSDWRLPNVNELRSIMDRGIYSPAIDETFFSGPYTFHWTSTTCEYMTSSAWIINCGGGMTTTTGKFGTFLVRPVRGGQ